jgi:hypothetical protein
MACVLHLSLKEGKGRKRRTEGVEGRERKEGEFGSIKNLVYTTTVTKEDRSVLV